MKKFLASSANCVLWFTVSLLLAIVVQLILIFGFDWDARPVMQSLFVIVPCLGLLTLICSVRGSSKKQRTAGEE